MDQKITNNPHRSQLRVVVHVIHLVHASKTMKIWIKDPLHWPKQHFQDLSWTNMFQISSRIRMRQVSTSSQSSPWTSFHPCVPCTKKNFKTILVSSGQTPNRLFLLPAHHEVAKHPPRCGRDRVPELDLGFPVFQILGSYHDRDWGWFTLFRQHPYEWWLGDGDFFGFGIYQRKWCQMAPNGERDVCCSVAFIINALAV